ncbi:MAG: phosphodiester glycosidase family protein [Lachnospiraceae bacterium]
MKNKRPLKLLTIDLGLTLVLLGIFLLHFYVLPQNKNSEGIVIGDTNSQTGAFELPSATAAQSTSQTTPPGERERKPGSENDENPRKGKPGSSSSGSRDNPGNGNTGTTDIESDTVIQTSERQGMLLHTLYEEDIHLTIRKNEIGSGDEQITYYVADVYLTSVNQLKTAFAKGTYGKNMRETTQQMAEDNQALLAISGDSYGNNENGIVVRNGILYRSETNDAEICVLFTDGTMKIYEPEEFEEAAILEQDVWQAWNFGPSLLKDGAVKSTFRTTSYLNRANPRCAIGYIAPGHYLFVLVDGRDQGYSKGATMTELAQIMADEGCTLAYNLDGGKSSAMVYSGEYINQPADGGRTISDIIYLERTK